MPEPVISTLKISWAKINGPTLTGNGSYVGYLVQRMGCTPVQFEDDPPTEQMLLSMYGPMQADIDAFLTAMNKPHPAFVYELSEALEEWRNNGAIAKHLHEVVAEVKRRAGKGKAIPRPVSRSSSYGQASSYGRGSSSSSNFQWRPTISSSTSSARHTQESTSPRREWQ